MNDLQNFQMANNDLRRELEKLEKDEMEIDKLLQNVSSERVRQYQLNLFHEYNDLKDAAQAVMGLLADINGTTVTHVHERFGIDIKDQ